MTFIPEGVHVISIFFSVFVYMIRKRNFVPVQVIPYWGHSGFQSEWSSRSGSKFHSGIMYTENELRSVLENVNRLYIVLSKESGTCVSDLTPENALGWVLRICHVNAIRTSLRNESHSQMKVIPVAYKKPLRAYPYPFIYLKPEKGTLFRRNRPVYILAIREIKIHVCVNLYHVTKFSPYLSFTVYCFYTRISSFMPVLSVRIVLDCFIYLFSILRNSVLNLNLTFAVNVNLNLSILYSFSQQRFCT